jgi:hypothetical protein
MFCSINLYYRYQHDNVSKDFINIGSYAINFLLRLNPYGPKILQQVWMEKSSISFSYKLGCKLDAYQTVVVSCVVPVGNVSWTLF